MVKTDAEGAPTGQELPAELILAYLTSGRRVNRTRAAAALSELISVGLLACCDGRYSHSAEGASAREPSCFAPTWRSSAPQPPRRRLHLPGAPGRRRSPSGGGRPVASPRQKQDALR
jgi:hypothetical protein